MNSNSPMLGILGGMGPLATADFYTRLVRATPAARDQQHIPLVIAADPRVPDRTAAILSNAPGPVRHALQAGLKRLERAGASAIAMPCNTAHYWLDDLKRSTRLEILSIVDAALDLAGQRLPDARRVAVLATEGTRRARIYETALAERGLHAEPTRTEERTEIDAIIAAVKAGHAESARAHLHAVIDTAHRRADVVLLACTELPLALDPGRAEPPWLIDTTAALVGRCVDWYRAQISAG
ncbi:MAG: amino acid racemase [Wenzhouxiangellaceae bacterium]|nr:amino acid racemase [Wenzhouxiangellaceae bacterium]